MERRTFLLGAGGAALGTVWSGAPDWSGWSAWSGWSGGPDPSRSGPGAAARLAGGRVAVFDAELVEGRALAHHAARLPMPAWAIGDDVGALWHAQLARRLPQRTLLIGALRPSDLFVLTRLAATRDCALVAVAGTVAGGNADGHAARGIGVAARPARTGKRDSSDRT